MKEFVCTILLFTSITCAIAQRAIGSGTSVNVTQGVTASQVSDSITEVRTSFGDSITEIRNLIGGITVPIKQNIGGLYSAGYIDYIRDTIYIGFSVTPAAGNVVLSYSKYTTLHSYGCWRKF